MIFIKDCSQKSIKKKLRVRNCKYINCYLYEILQQLEFGILLILENRKRERERRKKKERKKIEITGL